MRITKKIISLLLVVSMLASFMAMTGFEAGALAVGTQKTDFGLHFDDTTRKYKILQLSDIQTDVDNSNISDKTKQTIKMAIEQYDPDMILLTGDQTMGDAYWYTIDKEGAWKDTFDKVYSTFAQYIDDDVALVAVPGNHEYDFGSMNMQYEYYLSKGFEDWDNNFGTVDMEGAPGAGNVTISASSGNKAVALNLALFNSLDDDGNGNYLRPGGTDDAKYMEIVNWYKNMNEAIASSTYSYKAQKTGASKAYVPTFGAQHIILQEIYTEGAILGCDSTEPGAVPPGIDGDYSSLNPGPYYKLNPDRPHGGVMGEAPCGSGYSTRALYDALLEDGNFLGMTFGHDHLNSFDIVDDNGFHYYYGGALGLESYNSGNPTFRFFEFTLDDTTGEVSVASESNSYDNMTVNYANVDEERIEAINASGVQLPHTISVPRIIYVGGSINNETNIKNSQELGTTVQSALLDYQTKEGYTHDRTINVCVPEGSAFTHPQYLEVTCDGIAVSISDIRTDNSHAGLTVYSFDILTSNSLPLNKNIEYTVRYTAPNGKDYEIHSASYVQSIKQPAGYYDWMRSWRADNSAIESNAKNNSKNWIDAAVVQTLSGPNVFATANETSPEQNGGWSPNIYYKYDGVTGEDVDNNVVNKNGASDNTSFPMMFSSPSKDKGQDGLLRPHSINRPATNKLYIDVSTLKPVSESDSRLDLGARIDFWLAKDTDNGFPAHAAGIGFYEGSHTYSSGAATINPNDNYTYTSLAQAELGSNAGVDGTKDECSIFLYDGYANQQSVNGIGSTHVNHNTDSSTRIGTFRGHTAGWPLIADSVDAIKAMDGKTITMFTGVRVKGHNSINRQHMLTIISPYHINFYVHDKTALRDLVMQELMEPRIRSDYPHAVEGAEKAQLWTDYIEAYNLALSYYARTDIESQKVVDDHNTALVSAIAALLRSNMTEDTSAMVGGKAPISDVSVPPILYVSGSTIQTSDPFTDTAIKISGLPVGTSKVVIQAIKANADGTVQVDANGNEVTNTAVNFNGKTSGAAGSVELNINNDSTATGSIAGGTATADDNNASTNNDGYVYYKITYTVNGVEHYAFAASYVRAVPITNGRWIMKNMRRDGKLIESNRSHTAIHYDNYIDSTDAYSIRGASMIMSIYPIQSANSFDQSVLYPASGNLFTSAMGYEGDVGWSIGTSLYKDFGSEKSGYRANGYVTFYNDRGREQGEYWIGLSNVGGSSNEYVVSNFYFDADLVTSGTKFKTYITHKHGGNSSRSNCTNVSDGRQLWTLGTIGAIYEGWPGRSDGQATIETDTSNILQYVGTSTLDNRLSDSTGDLNGTIQNKIDLTTIARNSYKEAAGYYQRAYDGNAGWCSVSSGVAFKYNSVDRSVAHAVINESIAAEYNKADLKPDQWVKYRQEVIEAYVTCGNLWGSDFNRSEYDAFVDNPGKYREADYSVLTNAINAILTQLDDKGAATVKLSAGSAESILDYATVLYNVHNNDDSRYHGQKYNRTMFVKSAADLANLIKGRTEVYDAICTTGATPSDEGNNLHLAHLDFRYQKYITDYANAITAEWAKLRLLPADYTSLNKYLDYCDLEHNAIYFKRDDNAGYNNDLQLRNDANEKTLPFGVFTTQSWKNLVAATNLPEEQLNLKKPSEQEAIGDMPQIYPNDYQFTTKYPTASANNDTCLYNTARNAYEDLEFRRAAEYYTTDGTYTEDGVTYYANYNMTKTDSKYIYTPVFSTNEMNWPANVVNRGYAVVDKEGNILKLYETYHAGNARYVNVTNGAGEVVSQVSPWTEASWGDQGYGFQDAYEDAYGTNSHYDETNDSADKYEYALYVETKILPEIANADYYFDHLVASTADYSQFNNEKTTYAFYEKFGGGYDALAGYEILDANGNVLTDGAQWYTADTWKAYIDAKNALPAVMDGASLEENQNIINLYTQEIYKKRNALQLRPMEDYKVSDGNGGYKTFASINADAQAKYDEVNNKKVQVFALRAQDPASYLAVAGREPHFITHPYYLSDYIQKLGSNDYGLAGLTSKAGKSMAENIGSYITAVSTFETTYAERIDSTNLNKANTDTLQLLLNKTWIPEFDTYGVGNYDGKNFILGGDFDGSKWYTAETWENYVNARNNALKFFDSDTFAGAQVAVLPNYYGSSNMPQGDYFVDKQGAEFTIDKTEGSPTYSQPVAVDGSDLTGTVNKAAYDLVVAYYRLQYKKISDSDESFSNVNGGTVAGYRNVVEYMSAVIEDLKDRAVDVYFIDEAGNLVTEGDAVKHSAYSEAYIAELNAIYNTVSAWGASPEYKLDADGNETTTPNYKYAEYYNAYLKAVADFNELAGNPVSATVYMEGWNSLYAYLNKNAAEGLAEDQTAPVISDAASMNDYFRNIFGDYYDPEEYYNDDTWSISRTLKAFAEIKITDKASLYQVDVNTFLERLYGDLTATSAKAIPVLVTKASEEAYAVIANTSGNAYDPLQLNNRPQVTGITEYTPDSMQALRDVIDANTKSVPFWTAKPSQTGYNSTANKIDGSYADNMWAAAGLTTEGGVEYAADKSVNDRYVLVKGGRFLDALKDAITYAEVALYKNTEIKETDENGKEIVTYKFELKDGNKIIKDFTVLKGDGTIDYTAEIFTAESIKELTDALEVGYGILAETEGSYTDQAGIDQAVFDILEESDIKNELDLKVKNADGTAGGFYGTLGHKAEDEGLKYKPADLTYFNEELATKYSYANMSESAQTLVKEVWVDSDNDGDFDFVTTRNQAYLYFDNTLWNNYDSVAYTDALAVKNLNETTPLTAADQDKVNNSATAVYTARNALKWNVIDTHLRWQDAQKIGAEIETLSSKKVFVNVFANSELSADGTYLTAPSTTQVEASEYGQEAINTITTMWQEFQDKYPSGSEYANYIQMVADYEKLNAAYSNLAAKPMSVDSDFAEGAKDLVDNFIAGTYDFTTGIYVADYQTTIATGLSDAETTARETQYNTIKGYLDEIRELLNGKNTINDPSKYSDSEGKPLTYLEALNDRTMKLYEYLTTTPAQYAGFALDMRQNMIDYFNSTIDVVVKAENIDTAAENYTIYKKKVRVFTESARDSVINKLNTSYISNSKYYTTINLMDDCVGLNFAEDVDYSIYRTMKVENRATDGTIKTTTGLSIMTLFQYVGAYSQYYNQMAEGKFQTTTYANAHDMSVYKYLTETAVYTSGDNTYILAAPAIVQTIGGAELHYAMDIDPAGKDGEWYTDGYGNDIKGNGDIYYLAASKENVITGSENGGWFTDESYGWLLGTIKEANEATAFVFDTAGSIKLYGLGTEATNIKNQVKQGNKVGTGSNYCWNAKNRTDFINAIQADQNKIDEYAGYIYEDLTWLELLPATDAYREVAGLIYAAMGKVPSYSYDNKSGVIINNSSVGTLTDYKIGDDVCGQVFNTSLLTQLGKENEGYYVREDTNGTKYYAPGLPAGYTNGVTDVERILTMLQTEVDTPVTVDKAVLVSDNTANNGINSVKERILAELEKLTLGLADLSLITSLTKAFLYNNPSHEESLGSYREDSEFFVATHYYSELGKTGNAEKYKNDPLMKLADNDYHASGFYDFSKYTTTSLNAVITYLQLNYIITGETAREASNFDIDNKTGFNIVFGESNYGTAYSTAVTQQQKIDEIYAGLVSVINNLELRAADTVALKAEIEEAEEIKLNKDLYDYESDEGKAAWDEFIKASQVASSYENATVINEKQVEEAENELSRAIKALKLNVDSYAPVVTIHNTQSDLTKFHDAHKELKAIISDSDDMVAPSYMEPGLGGYTLYVYTNQINPHIVVSLKDATVAANGDGSTREVKASKPEKMTVTAQAMSGVTASVITPVFDANGVAESAQKVAIAGETVDATSASTQTAKTLVKDAAGNETYNYAAGSSAYIVLNPSFEGVKDGDQSAVAYSINATDSAVEKVANGEDDFNIVPKENSASSLGYTTGSIAAEEITGNITVFVYYMNSMPEDGNDSGVVDGTVNASAVLTTNEKNGLKADKWTNHAMLYRTFAKPVRSWEFSETSAQLEKKGAAYYDPTFGENNFGSFAYVLDPDATQGFDFEVAAAYFAENGGEAAAKAKAIELLKSDNDYITQFNGYVETGSTAVGQYGYKHYGAHDINGQYENWEKPMGNIDNGTLVFIHVADRFGNVCNRIIEWKNYDPYYPVLSTEEAGKVSVTEPGGSGVAKVDLFKDMGTFDDSLYIGDLYDMLHIEGATYATEGNTFTISAGAENANKHFTVAVTDNAGNVKSIPVNADANGDIVITVTQTFDNVANYKAKPISNVATESGEDLSVIEFVFNGESTVLLNYSEPTSIVKAGPDGNVFANKKNVPLNIITKAEVESVKLYNVATGTEEIWTAENATVKDNGDGTETWTVKYTFAEGEHNYKATAMVEGKWEASSVDFDFTATTKKVSIVTSPIGAGRTELSFNNGSVRMASAYDKVEVPYGSVVKIKATSINESSDFFYWENGYTRRIISTADTTEFIAVANMNLTAQFTTTELITNDKKLVVYVNNAENVVDSYELADGDDYKVPAAPSLAEHVFKSWSMTKDEVLASAEKLIVVRPIYSLVVKNTVTLTEGNWTATGAGEYETVGDERPVATVSASAADEAGAGFLYWLDAETGEIASYNRTYTFYVIKDTELTPVYGDASAVMPVPVARIATVKYDDKADKVSFFAERSVPAGYTMIQTGIVVTKSESVASNEDAFILDASGVSKGTSKSLSASGYYSASVSATSGVTAYARAYVIYANADGDIIHYYSPVSSYTA